MTDSNRDPAIRGKVIQFTWTEGPTKVTTHEHVFHEDGTVEWREPEVLEPARTGAQRSRPADKPAYAAIRVAEETYIVSYLAASGYTLTVVLNFRDRQLIGFASGAKEWYPLTGTLESSG